MKVAIRYDARNDNVRIMAEAISRGTGVEAIATNDPRAEITEPIDLLFLGGASYGLHLDKDFREYVENLPEDLIKEVICFGSSGLTRRPILIMQDILKTNGIKINRQAIYSRGKPNDDLIGVIEYFAQNELTRDRSLDGLPPYKIFQRSQEIKAEREAAAAAAAAAAEKENASDEEADTPSDE